MCDVVHPVTLPPFQVLIDAHRDDVYRFLRASVGPHDADDCFQETFLTAQGSIRRFNGDSKFLTWLLGIALRRIPVARIQRELNSCINWSLALILITGILLFLSEALTWQKLVGLATIHGGVMLGSGAVRLPGRTPMAQTP